MQAAFLRLLIRLHRFCIRLQLVIQYLHKQPLKQGFLMILVVIHVSCILTAS